jgi:hypothetical protein
MIFFFVFLQTHLKGAYNDRTKLAGKEVTISAIEQSPVYWSVPIYHTLRVKYFRVIKIKIIYLELNFVVYLYIKTL